jgi:bifunctional DNA-binding transcriptional regulator/antitoxin component of YhaV-PrlF toxin-antitoxin module
VPAEIRRELGLQRGDPVAFILENGHVRFERAQSVVERTRGVFKHDGPVLSAEELREAAEIAWVEDALKRMGG